MDYQVLRENEVKTAFEVLAIDGNVKLCLFKELTLQVPNRSTALDSIWYALLKGISPQFSDRILDLPIKASEPASEVRVLLESVHGVLLEICGHEELDLYVGWGFVSRERDVVGFLIVKDLDTIVCEVTDSHSID